MDPKDELIRELEGYVEFLLNNTEMVPSEILGTPKGREWKAIRDRIAALKEKVK